MSYLEYLLPVLLCIPILVGRLSLTHPRLRGVEFLGPFGFIALSALSYINKAPIELSIAKFSTFFTIGLKLDVLAGLIAATVSTIGIVVSRYSTRFLEDDPNKLKFFKNLSFTLSSVLSMLLAPNLVLLFLSWVGTSYFLHQLLTHFSERPAAVRAAEQKFWVSRLGDVFIISAAVIYLIIFGSLEFETIFQMAKNSLLMEENHTLLNISSLFLVFGAMTKSTQFPFHFWLPNTMEAPTPVSAIMHAGIINAGGYLVVRMSPILSETPLALCILAVVGSFTAFWATIVMFTQSNVKRNLAYSTISQMGFMMLQCGLGAFSIAVVHIIGHAFYKAYAFLSAGTATDLGRLNRYFPKTKVAQGLWAPFIVAFTVMTTILGSYKLFGYSLVENSGTSILLLVLSLAVSQIILNSKNKMRGIISACFIILLYLGLTVLMKLALEGVVPMKTTLAETTLGAISLLVSAVFFIALYLIQNSLDRISHTDFGKHIYVKALRGGI